MEEHPLPYLDTANPFSQILQYPVIVPDVGIRAEKVFRTDRVGCLFLVLLHPQWINHLLVAFFGHFQPRKNLFLQRRARLL